MIYEMEGGVKGRHEWAPVMRDVDIYYQDALIQKAEMDREISPQNRALTITFLNPDPTISHIIL